MLIDNKKTREISWNDFELEGNKENLIKHGWDSFGPWGSGKNYVENWDFESDDLRGFIGSNAMEVSIVNNKLIGEVGETGELSASAILIQNIPNLPLGEYLFRAKLKSTNTSTRIYYRTRSNATDRKQEIFELDKTDIIEFYFSRTVLDDFDIWVYANNPINSVNIGDKIEIDWVQITPVDNQHLVVEKTPLGNGLTRIQTWGGNDDMKLKSPNFGQLAETGTDMTISLYVENNSDSMIRFSNNLAISGEPYPDGAKYMITVPREYKGFAYLKGELVGGDVELDIRSDGNIDMIVSQPEIIEGHDLNAMLFIEDLDDGRKHIQVHNVNENTKLVYTGGGVIKGEPYTLETEIENDGRIFNLSANMLDSVVEVQKGMNDIKKSGELQDKELKIEIGVD